jgi:cbb3-type cytochrome oxidase maturation protein
MNWVNYIPLVILPVLIFTTAIFAFLWSIKNGEFRDLEAQARSIFDESEPEGVPTDFFPGKAPRAPQSTSPIAPEARHHS